MRRPILAGCLLLALGSVASSQSADDALSPIEVLSRTLTAPAPAPDGAKTDAGKKPAVVKAAVPSVDPLTQCLRDWDAGTHMTRQEWARTCRRVVVNRLKLLSTEAAK